MGEQCSTAESSKSKLYSTAPVIKLASDSAGQYVVAATGEEKAIIVFKLSTDGFLSYSSERYAS